MTGVITAIKSSAFSRVATSSACLALSRATPAQIAKARQPSIHARWVSNMRLISGCTISGSAGLSGYFVPDKDRPCRRSLARPPHLDKKPRPNPNLECPLTRSVFIIANMARIPLCGSPANQPVAPSKFSTHVAEALMPILCSMEAQATPLRWSKRTIILRHKLRYHKKADAFHALGCIGQFRQHQVNDIFRKILFTRRNENLGARNLIAAISLWNGLRSQQTLNPCLQCGSVKHMVPPHVPSTILGRTFASTHRKHKHAWRYKHHASAPDTYRKRIGRTNHLFR